MAKEKKAKKVFTLEDIKYKEANQWLGVIACVPIIGLILMLVEKEDNFVRYIGAQYAILGLITGLVWIPVLGQILGFVLFVLMIVGMVKSYNGERFDIPGIFDLALKLLTAIG